jgi:TRAP-type mannitol/chloroaromatic compound transport system permease small subunit
LAIISQFVRTADRLNDVIGRGVSWLTLAMVLVTFVVVVLRYVFAIGWVALQESYVWMHGVVFMVGAGYTLLHNGHVRVDIFYRPASMRFRALVDLVGVFFLLLPMIVLVSIFGFDYVASSWALMEASREAGGLPGLYLLKSIILVFCVLTAIQGLSLAARSALVLLGHAEYIAEAEAAAKV